MSYKGGKGGGRPPASHAGEGMWGRRTDHGIFVGNLPMTASTQKLWDHFEQFGEVAGIDNHYLQGFAFVNFATHQGKSRALIEPEISFGGEVLNIENRKGDSAGAGEDEAELRLQRQLQARQGQGKGGAKGGRGGGEGAGGGKGGRGGGDAAGPTTDTAPEKPACEAPPMSAAEKRRMERLRMAEEKKRELAERTERIRKEEEEAAARAAAAQAAEEQAGQTERGAEGLDWDAVPSATDGWTKVAAGDHHLPAPQAQLQAGGRGRGRGQPQHGGIPPGGASPQHPGLGPPPAADPRQQQLDEALLDLQNQRDTGILSERDYAVRAAQAYARVGIQAPPELQMLAAQAPQQAPVATPTVLPVVRWKAPGNGPVVCFRAAPEHGRVQYSEDGACGPQRCVSSVVAGDDGNPYLEFETGKVVELPREHLGMLIPQLQRLFDAQGVRYQGLEGDAGGAAGRGRGRGAGAAPPGGALPEGGAAGRQPGGSAEGGAAGGGRGYTGPPGGKGKGAPLGGRGRGGGRN
eukprot:TRINITY_DN1889_c0_g2_i1.p1 TRINITY_DN1889_c0_g2~~TRINITY_DN1889_c0_g2_i1.p1  ORF type:complete len:550 (+),score=151.87 TRINITY_DN1889_c0_g2_i1:92-1651(+)